MTQILILAQSVGVGHFFAGTVVALPVAVIALLAVMIAQWPRWRTLLRVSRWLGWFVLAWNLVCGALLIYKEEMPRGHLYEFYDFILHGEFGLYIVFFGPSTLLAVIALVMVRRAKHLIEGSANPVPKCEKCGYLLIGLEMPRCPECGMPFDPALLAANRNGPGG
jgi:hypothetical protein